MGQFDNEARREIEQQEVFKQWLAERLEEENRKQ